MIELKDESYPASYIAAWGEAACQLGILALDMIGTRNTLLFFVSTEIWEFTP